MGARNKSFSTLERILALGGRIEFEPVVLMQNDDEYYVVVSRDDKDVITSSLADALSEFYKRAESVAEKYGMI